MRLGRKARSRIPRPAPLLGAGRRGRVGDPEVSGAAGRGPPDRPPAQHPARALLWAAGYHLNRGEEDEGDKLLLAANRFDLDRSVDRAFSEPDPHSRAVALERDFPLDKQDVAAIGKQLGKPENLARDLVGRFSPKWFLGWRRYLPNAQTSER